ncbi:MAG: lipopolysaccharide transport system permease protein [Chthoniobacter sp.]|jgi:lipopolysaccharide transport system permease protein|nr:lipopolysaccharide transport system permease protein [Chthoniobacter sp.]
MLVMAELKAEPYEVIIERSRGWLSIDWREFWEYRDLLVLLVQRDVTSRYKQTLLGPLWFILQPVLTAMVFAIIFGRIAGIPTDGIPGPLFYLCGLLGWTYFSQNLTNAGASFVNNAHLFGKVYFPRLIVPVAIVLSNLVAFAIQLGPFLLFLGYYKLCTQDASVVHLTWKLLLVPLPLLQVVALSLGVSLLMSAATARYRDLIHLNQFLIQIWMFATPIFYPLSKVPPQWQWVIWANPMSVPVEAFRICLLGRGTLGTAEIVISAASTVLLLAFGIAAFQKVERTMIDSV